MSLKPIDPKLNEEVWNRVMASQNGMPPQNGMAQQTAASPEAVLHERAEKMLSFMQAERNDCATYRYMACKTCGAEAKALQGIAADESRHYQKLNAMYFLLTGKCACLQPVQPECISCLADALRARFTAELEGAKEYEQVAAQCTPMAQEFQCLADDEMRHSRIILSLLECRL